jgi:RIO kinase 1
MPSPLGKSNPRKMVKVWAEKEMRNYRRIYNAGIPCPAPILLKSHVLIMEFLGENGWPSPRIRDANLSEKRLREAYVQTIIIMRRMFQRCKLVHGDLSEYNLLWHKNEVYVIDVSQSVESDHPSALDFLRNDGTFLKCNMLLIHCIHSNFISPKWQMLMISLRKRLI